MEIDEEALQQVTAKKKIYSMLGLAAKGGRIASGEFMTEKTIKGGGAFLCIVAEDASDNTKKMFRNMCEFYNVPFCCFSDKDTLGHWIGKEFRASLAILDEGMAKVVQKHLGTLLDPGQAGMGKGSRCMKCRNGGKNGENENS